MSILFYGIGVFIMAFLIHLSCWRFNLTKKGIGVLLRIFLGTWIVGLILIYLFKDSFSIFGVPAPRDIIEYIRLSMLYIALVLAYTTTYTAVDVDSPSLVMTKKIADAGAIGLTKDRLEHDMTDDSLVMPRIRDLLVSGLAREDGGIYRITKRGKLIAGLFIAYRKVLDRQESGG